MSNEVTPRQPNLKEALTEHFYRSAGYTRWDDIENDRELAGELADEVITIVLANLNEHLENAKPTFKEEWRDIPGYRYWQMSNGYLIRHKMSHVQVPVSAIFGEPVIVTIHDDMGMDARVRLEDIIKRTWPETLEEGDLEEPESFAEEWKAIDCIPGCTSFQVSNYGRIRYKFNDRIIEPSFDCELDKHVVKVTVNAVPISIDGPGLAATMWSN